MHVLPQLRELEERYPSEIAIVGVHSGKYTAERETPRIADASLRLHAVHPTINDRQFRLWRAYAVRAWPTLVAIDPTGYVIGMSAGEFTADKLAPFVERVLAEAREKGTLVPGAIELRASSPTMQPGILAFPGKVAVSGSRIAISDSGHARVLVGTLDETGLCMRVSHEVTGSALRLHNPQGLALGDDALYIADPGTHTVRVVELATGRERVLCGIGRQLRTAVDEAQGALSSPWDLALDGDTLHIAMAGVHQLWKADVRSGGAEPYCGTGAEELHDAPHDEAALAQPMGLCLAGDTLYFVDAESSAVRMTKTVAGSDVTTLLGTGLFDFGDVDGTGDDVRMQHQQGIAMATNGRLLVCDSYNDVLKWVDPATRRAERWVSGLHEPGGVALSSRAAYVADTNAHCIAVVNLESAEVQDLSIDR